MLAGITYDVVLELADKHHIRYEVRKVSEQELRTAEELLLTSSTKEILPITRLDNQPIGKGVPGEVFKRLYLLYQDYKETVMRGNSTH